ncbi:MAG: hypothetical protein ACI351_07945 [Candidatus Avelusimicrobium sp.]|uniref:hypothetical protein n=1 Tax=Candidatus Avelusimicrobium sp. TaxID=3048833 RepID=UPI003F122917
MYQKKKTGQPLDNFVNPIILTDKQFIRWVRLGVAPSSTRMAVAVIVTAKETAAAPEEVSLRARTARTVRQESDGCLEGAEPDVTAAGKTVH